MEKTFETNKQAPLVIYGAILIVGVIIGWLLGASFSTSPGAGGGKNTNPPLSLSDITITNENMNGIGSNFIGKWKGTWNASSRLEQYYVSAIFAVTGINSNGKAQVVYSWGGNSYLKLTEGKYEGEGTFLEDGSLVIRLPSTDGNKEGIIVTFRDVDTTGRTLAGMYQISTQPASNAIFEKVD